MTARQLAYHVLSTGLIGKIDGYAVVSGFGNVQNTNTIAINIMQETLTYTQSENRTDNNEDTIRHIKLMFNLNAKLNKKGFSTSKDISLYESYVQDLVHKIDIAVLRLQSQIGTTETDTDGITTSVLEDVSLITVLSSELIETDTIQFFGTMTVRQTVDIDNLFKEAE